jgi:hypothetical protein
MTRLAPIVLALSALALCGCGRDGDRGAAQLVTERFFAALQGEDGALACAQLSAETRAELESQEGKPCREAIVGLGLQGAGITRVQVFLTNAKADLADGDSVFLGLTSQGWRLSAIGCEPQDDKPADRPFDCTVQA